MMLMRKLLILIITLATLLLTNSCIKEAIRTPEKFDPLESRTGVPLINADISLASTLNKIASLEVNSIGGFYEMVIKPEKFDFTTAENLIVFPSQILNATNVATLPVAGGSGSFNVTVSTSVGVDFTSGSILSAPGTTFRKIYFKAGTIDFTLSHNLLNRTINPITITFPTIKNNDNSNASLVITSNTALADNTDGNYSGNLNGYNIDLITNGNNIPFQISITVTSGTVVTNGSLSVKSVGINNVKWQRIEGKLGTMQIPLVENNLLQLYKFEVSPFSSNVDNNDPVVGPTLDFEFVNASLKTTFSSQFGLDCGVIVSPLKGFSENGTRVTSSINGVTFSISPPKPNDPVSPTAIIEPIQSVKTITSETLNPLLKSGPTSLSYGLILTINGANTTNTDFIHDVSRISAQSELRLPFNGRGKFFNLQKDVEYPTSSETGAFNLSDSITATINSATFLLKTENSLPIEFEISLVFLDENKLEFDEIKSSVNGPAIKVEGAGVDANGKSNSTKTSSTQSIINNNRFIEINKKCKFIRINARPQTTSYDTPGKYVKVFPTDKLNVQMSVIINTKVEQK